MLNLADILKKKIQSPDQNIGGPNTGKASSTPGQNSQDRYSRKEGNLHTITKPRDMIIRDVVIAKIMEFCGMELAREAVLVTRNRVRLHVSPAERFKIRPHDRSIISALSKSREHSEPLRINSIH